MVTQAVEPQPGDIGCTSIQGDVGFLIKLGQFMNGNGWSNFEHSFVAVGGGQIVEAEPDGARLANLDEYDPRTVVWIRCPDAQRQAVTASANALIGTPYGFLDYAALALHRFHIPFPGLKKYCDSDKSLICSQLVVVAARRGGWNLLAPEPPGYVTPAQLARLAEPPA